MLPLERLIRARILDSGPITVAAFMELALTHPLYGYYMKNNPFGVMGDFITAPDISQVFGELIGMWGTVCWQQMGCPSEIQIVECGPGRGTLMNDFLRAAKNVPDFLRALNIHLIEISPVLRSQQSNLLKEFKPTWHRTIETVPLGPTILIANEFLDALPVHQLVKTDSGWTERYVDSTNDHLTFAPGNKPTKLDKLVPENIQDAECGSVYEVSTASLGIADSVSSRLTAAPGYALFIDYGHEIAATGETLQAVKAHKFTNVLKTPGSSDLTTHVDFASFGNRIRSNGLRVLGPTSQAGFLKTLGIQKRAENLMRHASPDQVSKLRSSTQRLIDPGQMGSLYRVMAAAHPELEAPAGFEGERHG
ncbi:MAG: SAM-dependent methyltransferase [Pseudomonadota bacterium]|nr:SAM-dependent methyltransferase [Pseudomonadota bacterium]